MHQACCELSCTCHARSIGGASQTYASLLAAAAAGAMPATVRRWRCYAMALMLWLDGMMMMMMMMMPATVT
jgi:hypothetical protein